MASFSDPHKLYAEPDPAFLTNVDPDPIPDTIPDLDPDPNPGLRLSKVKYNFIK
jgi:hypothetical protein